MKSDLFPNIEINSKWIIHLNVRAKTARLLEENIEVNLHNLGLSKDFLDMTLKI